MPLSRNAPIRSGFPQVSGTAQLKGLPGDAGLRSEVERLLAAHEMAGPFIQVPAASLAGLGTVEDSINGRRIGVYRVVGELGRGGMGAVYLAERADGQYEQRVALKLIKRGMDTEEVLDRFRAERQILASLDHPNIARLLDGGSTEQGCRSSPWSTSRASRSMRMPTGSSSR